MDFTPQAKIYTLVRSLALVAHKKRQQFLCALLQAIIKSRSVLFAELAHHIDSPSKTTSVERRVQDFFQKVDFNYSQLARLLLSFIHHPKVVLSLDRTEWDFGKTQINILCAIASIGKMGVPLYFELLDNNSGNSNAGHRIALLTQLIKLIGKERIALLVMDREFVGQQWLSWLKKQQVPFCVRLPKHHRIQLLSGEQLAAEKVCPQKGSFKTSSCLVDGVVVNVSVSRVQQDELLYLIGTADAHQLKQQYKKRWTIEVFFQALKSRGFHLEQSCLRSLVKYKKLFAVVCLAYTLCWATGIEQSRKKPVKQKKHGYPQYSVFRRGLNSLRSFFEKPNQQDLAEPLHKVLLLAQQRILYQTKTIG
jgi:hypothetical protein